MMIEARDLEQTFQSGGRPLTVLHGIDLDVADDEFVAILGPSGSGKSTLLGLLAGLDTPTAGTVRLDGHDLFAMSEDERARFRASKIGFVFQTFQLIATLTAAENVVVPLELGGPPPSGAGGGGGAGGGRARVRGGGWRFWRNGGGAAERRAVAEGLLGRVGLGDRLGHYPAQLSGGEQQRVALARAFANRPRILFADEPTGNLDAVTGASIIDAMVELNRAQRTTLVLVTHDMELADRASRVIRLAGGRIVSDEVRA
jgi:putative ABC transport system ATP-binding protein